MTGLNKVRAFLGLGGNLGDPRSAMASALQMLDAQEEIAIIAVSSLYSTPPWGVTDQPDFLNAVAALETSLSARALLDVCLSTEQALKRERIQRWGPRIIDVDVLLYGDASIQEDGLQVPHPRMMERAFVLAPLIEIAPSLHVQGQSIQDALNEADKVGIVQLETMKDWWRVNA